MTEASPENSQTGSVLPNASAPAPQQASTDSPTHDGVLSQLHGEFGAVWNWLKGLLPAHASKEQVLTDLTNVYNSAAQVVKDDAAKVVSAAEAKVPVAEHVVQEGVTAAEHAVESAVPVVEQAAEQVVKDL